MSEAKDNFYKSIKWGRGKETSFKIVIDAAQDYIKELEEQNKWISVDDRLPINNNAVFCFTTDAVMAYRVFRYYTDNIEARFWTDEFGNVVDGPDGEYITHWQPLPSAPEIK